LRRYEYFVPSLVFFGWERGNLPPCEKEKTLNIKYHDLHKNPITFSGLKRNPWPILEKPNVDFPHKQKAKKSIGHSLFYDGRNQVCPYIYSIYIRSAVK